ncbi:hypothetical protein ACLB2K_028021 [Fragaria x ananassa]
MIRHHFHSEVWQPEILPGVSIPSCSDLFSIKFQLFEAVAQNKKECNGGDESSNQKRFDNLEAKKEGEEEEEECVICLGNISDFGPKSVTPCSHIYHSDCIWKWQKETQKKGHLFSCPVCRCHIAEMAGEPSQPLPLPALSQQPPPYQIINEEEDDVETDPRPEPSWCEVGCTLTTLLRIRFCFLSSCF